MKRELFLLGILVVLVCISVDARRSHGRSHRLVETDKNHRGGRRPELGRDNNNLRDCTCRRQCRGNWGEKLMGCHTNRTAYIRCQGATCSVELCPVNQLFNNISKACESCPAGFHVDAHKRHCVCDEGTTFDRRSRSCVSCPTGSVVRKDECYCNKDVIDKKANACIYCPWGSTKGRHGCVCMNNRFWSSKSLDCVACPGDGVRLSEGSGRRRQHTAEVCECQGEKEIFNGWSETCVRCPDNSIVVKLGKSYCYCTSVFQRYDWETNTCIDRSADDVHDYNEGVDYDDLSWQTYWRLRCPDNSREVERFGKFICLCKKIGQRYDWNTNTCINRSADDVHDDNGY